MSHSPSAVDSAASMIPEMMRAAVETVFRTMAQRHVKLLRHSRPNGPALARDAWSRGAGPVVVATVGFDGRAHGAVHLLVSQALAIELAGDILGLDPLDPENGGFETVKDAIVELTNVTAGSFKSRLCEFGFSCHLTTPNVRHGAVAPAEDCHGGAPWILEFETRDARFAVEVFFDPVS